MGLCILGLFISPGLAGLAGRFSLGVRLPHTACPRSVIWRYRDIRVIFRPLVTVLLSRRKDEGACCANDCFSFQGPGAGAVNNCSRQAPHSLTWSPSPGEAEAMLSSPILSALSPRRTVEPLCLDTLRAAGFHLFIVMPPWEAESTASICGCWEGKGEARAPGSPVFLG